MEKLGNREENEEIWESEKESKVLKIEFNRLFIIRKIGKIGRNVVVLEDIEDVELGVVKKGKKGEGKKIDRVEESKRMREMLDKELEKRIKVIEDEGEIDRKREIKNEESLGMKGLRKEVGMKKIDEIEIWGMKEEKGVEVRDNGREFGILKEKMNLRKEGKEKRKLVERENKIKINEGKK